MGQNAARIVTGPRPRWRAYLLLARVSNLPTVWTNVIAGTVLADASLAWSQVVLVSVAVSLLYTGGMFLNDAFDLAFDAGVRSDRPLPSGDVSKGEAFGVGFSLLAAGAVALVAWRPSGALLFTAVFLAVAIVYYDYRHKRDVFGPVAMGICRGLVYCVAAAAAAGIVASRVIVGAAVLGGYVAALTWVAKVHPRAGSLMPVLIAGISLLDAAIVAWAGLWPMAGLTALGFALTLALQRIVPGT